MSHKKELLGGLWVMISAAPARITRNPREVVLVVT